MTTGPHRSHLTRTSDASTFDEICIKCGATDHVPGGWGDLAKPCPGAATRAAQHAATLALLRETIALMQEEPAALVPRITRDRKVREQLDRLRVLLENS